MSGIKIWKKPGSGAKKPGNSQKKHRLKINWPDLSFRNWKNKGVNKGVTH